MKVRNKFVASALAACLMVGTVTPVWAGTIQNSPAVTTEANTEGTTYVQLNNDLVEGQDVATAPISAYNSFTGTVIAINDHTEENTLIVTVEHAEGGLANIIVKPGTALIDMDKLEVGQIITAFYYSNTPMIMIYPSQYVAQVVVKADNPAQNVVVDIFDENMLSFDGTLHLNIGKDTIILNIDGTPFDGSIEDLIARHLIVFYSVATFSLPAQTTPSVIYVIPMEGMQTYETESQTVPATPYVIGGDVIISGDKVNTPVQNNDHGVSVVSLRPVAEALGLNVNWNGELRVITIGDNIVIDIDAQTVTKDGELVSLNVAPAIIDGVTYVSLEFITAVLGIPSAR